MSKPIVVLLAPEYPAEQRNHVRALKAIGCDVVGIGEKPFDQIDEEMKGQLVDYEQGVPRNEGAVLAAAKRIAGRHRIARLEATQELHMLAAARAREALSIPGVPGETVRLCRDKFLMKQFLRARGIPCAKAREIGSLMEVRGFAKEVGFPFIIKPRLLAGSLNTWRIENFNHLGEALSAINFADGYIAEEWITGHEGMYDTLVCGGKIKFDAISHYYPNVLDAKRNRWISPICITTNRLNEPFYDEVRKFGARVVEALGLENSPTHMEWFHTPKGLYLGEIGARPPGDRFWDVYNWANDFDLYLEWARMLIHGECDPRPSRRYSCGMVAVRADHGGTITHTSGVEEVWRRCGGEIIELSIPPSGKVAPDVGAPDIEHAYAFLKNESYDACKESLEYIARTLHVYAK